MLRITVQLESEWRVWPMLTDCQCEDSTGKRLSLPFFSIIWYREKVA